MREYELVYIVQPDASAEREAEILDQIRTAITRAEGIVLGYDDWGKRRLAYEIRKFQKGHYFLLNFLGNGDLVPGVERILRLDSDVLRFLTVKVDERVKDVEQRIERARGEEEERARKRAERERQEEERAARERAAAEAAAAAGQQVRGEGPAAEAEATEEHDDEASPSPSRAEDVDTPDEDE